MIAKLKEFTKSMIILPSIELVCLLDRVGFGVF